MIDSSVHSRFDLFTDIFSNLGQNKEMLREFEFD